MTFSDAGLHGVLRVKYRFTFAGPQMFEAVKLTTFVPSLYFIFFIVKHVEIHLWNAVRKVSRQ